MIKIMTYGTFDLLHHGHIRLINRAKSLGDELIVAVSTDEFNLGKGKICTYPYHERAAILAALRDVDLVIPETSWDQKISDIKKYEIDIFVIGDDWKGHFDFLSKYCQVVYLPRTEGISTTKIKSILANKSTKTANDTEVITSAAYG